MRSLTLPAGRSTALRIVILIGILVAVFTAGGVTARPTLASSPSSGTIDGSAPVTWSFTDVGDTYALTVALPQAAATYYAPDAVHGTTHAAALTITVTYPIPTGDTALSVSATDSHGTTVGQSTLSTATSGQDTEALIIDNPTAQTYTITTGATAVNAAAEPSAATATLKLVDLSAQTPPAPAAGAPGYVNYELPQDIMPETQYEKTEFGYRAFGEPSVGVDPRNDNVLYQAGLFTLNGTFDNSNPAVPTWANVSSTTTNTATLDAIGVVDRGTGRWLVSQLTALCSLTAVSDTDGASWTPSAKPCETPPAVDHQTIGAGPFAAPLPNPGPVFQDAVYYCSQNIGAAECSLSLDGGLTYGQAQPLWTAAQCFGLHGHIKVGPDGTAYVPDKACGAPECGIITSTAGPSCHRGVAISTNNGTTWTVSTVPDSHDKYIAGGDPSVAVGAAGTLYYGYDNRDGHPKVAVSHDHGTTWTASSDVSGGFPIENTQMPVMVAGDDNRAAMAFLGSPYPGNDQDSGFVGTWHLYVATTYDGGATWTTVDTTPNRPVQRGCIEFGGSCPNASPDDQRNLLDFNDATLDKEGRVLVAYTDGCDSTCASTPADLSGTLEGAGGTRNPALMRQQCGRGLYAAYDAMLTACAPATSVAEAPIGGAALLLALGITATIATVRRRRRSVLSA